MSNPTAIETTTTTPVVKKTTKKTAKKTTPTPVTLAPTATPEVKKVEKPAKPEIKVADIKLPSGIIVKEMKSATTFFDATRKACLKGRNLELTDSAKIKDDRITILDKDYITTHHLGAMRAILKSVVDTKDLQSLLSSYFKS